MPDFIPRQDGELAEWSKNLCLQLTRMKEELQLRPDDLEALQLAQLDYASAYQLISNPRQKSPAMATCKNDARKILEKRIRLIWKYVQGSGNPDNGLRVILGMKPRTEKRRAVPPPNNINEWKYVGSATDIRYEFTLKHDLLPGDQIWVAARWCNRRDISPPSDPVRTFVQFTESNVGARSDGVDLRASKPLLEAA